jgi:hypothetical protein
LADVANGACHKHRICEEEQYLASLQTQHCLVSKRLIGKYGRSFFRLASLLSLKVHIKLSLDRQPSQYKDIASQGQLASTRFAYIRIVESHYGSYLALDSYLWGMMKIDISLARREKSRTGGKLNVEREK